MGKRRRKVEVICSKCNGEKFYMIDTWNGKVVKVNCSLCKGKGTLTEYEDD